MKIVLIKQGALTLDGYPLEKWVYTQPLIIIDETQSAILVRYGFEYPITAWFDKECVYKWFN